MSSSGSSYNVPGAPSNSTKSSPRLGPRPTLRHHETTSEATTELASAKVERERSFIPVIARVSTHGLRLEREYHLGKAFIQTSDPDCNHTVRLIELIRLPIRQGDSRHFSVEIFESPGRNYLRDLTDFGPAWYVSNQEPLKSPQPSEDPYSPRFEGRLSLTTFLDFAISASECLELLHHGLRIVHGELRADAFHFNKETGVVKLVNFGAGPRSFEHAGGLTSAGWSTLSRQTGIKTKLMFIAPEQTGRMPAEPDTRTDIYSLGILFWTMLTGEPAFVGETPMDIMQAVLGKRLPALSSIRFDVPDVLSGIIQRMTQKQIDDRYHSTSGLRHDLVELKRLLGEGDHEALVNFKIGSKDVSSFFILPTSILGRAQEQKKIIDALEKVAVKQQGMHQPNGVRMNSITSTSNSTVSDRNDALEATTRSSDTSSQAAKESEASAFEPVPSSNGLRTRQSSDEAQEDLSVGMDKPQLQTNISKDSVDTAMTVDSHFTGGTNGTRNSQRSKQLSTPTSRRSVKSKYGHRRRCEIISIYGSAGLGKSSLVQATQAEIRKRGYYASAKFDRARKVPFEPMLRAMSSLFRQIFSESDIHTPYHNNIRGSIRPVWPSLSDMLDLPDNLISAEAPFGGKGTIARPLNKTLRIDYGENVSSTTHSNKSIAGSQSTSEFLRGGASSHSSEILSIFLDVLRTLTAGKLICLSFDDLQFADEESLDLICSIISRKLGVALIVSKSQLCALSIPYFNFANPNVQFTCIEANELPKVVRSGLDSGLANVTSISLEPLTEQQVIEYVSSTLSRPHDYVHSLAVVCLVKSNGYVGNYSFL